MLNSIKLLAITLVLFGTIFLSFAHAQQTNEQKKKAHEARQIGNMLDMLGAVVDKDTQKQDEIYERVLRENGQANEQRRLQNQQDNNIDQFMKDATRQNDQRRAQSKAYQAHQSEMAAIIAARNARKNQYSGNAGGAIAGYGSNGLTAGANGSPTRAHVTSGRGTAVLASNGSSGGTAGNAGSATGGLVSSSVAAGIGGIIIDDTPTLEGIGRPSAKSPQTPRRVPTKSCECKNDDMKELMGIFCMGNSGASAFEAAREEGKTHEYTGHYPARDSYEPGYEWTPLCRYSRDD